MISADMLRYRKEMIRTGYRPNRRTVTDIIDSHLEALAEIEHLRNELFNAKLGGESERW